MASTTPHRLEATPGLRPKRKVCMDNENVARLQALEIKFAYQDQAISELSGLIYEYGKRIDSLEEKIQSTLARLAEMGNEKGPGSSIMAAQERPPHY